MLDVIPKKIVKKSHAAAIAALDAFETISNSIDAIQKFCVTSSSSAVVATDAAEWTSVADTTAAAATIAADASALLAKTVPVLHERIISVIITAIKSFVTSIVLLPDYHRTLKKMQSTKGLTAEEGNAEVFENYHAIIYTYTCASSYIRLCSGLTPASDAHPINVINIRNCLNDTMNAVKEAYETMVKLFVSYSKVCTETVLASKPEAASLGGRILCFTVSFDDAFLKEDLREVLEEHGTIINLVETPGVWDGYNGINDFVPENFAVELILSPSTNARSLFQSLVGKMLSAAPVF